MAGMFFFFAFGATGGMMSLVMQGKPIFESSHVTTGGWRAGGPGCRAQGKARGCTWALHGTAESQAAAPTSNGGRHHLPPPPLAAGLLGLGLLSFQAMLPLFFSEGEGARTVVGAGANGATPSYSSWRPPACTRAPPPVSFHMPRCPPCPPARPQHAYLGSAIMMLFVVHAGLGLQLGLSI